MSVIRAQRIDARIQPARTKPEREHPTAEAALPGPEHGPGHDEVWRQRGSRRESLDTDHRVQQAVAAQLARQEVRAAPIFAPTAAPHTALCGAPPRHCVAATGLHLNDDTATAAIV